MPALSLQCTHPHKLHDLENLTTPTEGEKGPLQSSDILGSRIGTPSAPVWSPGAAKHQPEEGAMSQARETKGCLDWHQRSKHPRWELKPQLQSQYSRDRCLILPHSSQLEGAQGGSGQEAGGTPVLTPRDDRRGAAVDTKYENGSKQAPQPREGCSEELYKRSWLAPQGLPA